MEMPKYFYFRVVSEHGTKVRIEDASDKDVVEVVRCKDCVSGVPHKLTDGRKVVVCTNVFAFADMGHDPDFYCKEGENK